MPKGRLKPITLVAFLVRLKPSRWLLAARSSKNLNVSRVKKAIEFTEVCITKPCLKNRFTLPLAEGSDEKSGEGLNDISQFAEQLTSPTLKTETQRESDLVYFGRVHFQACPLNRTRL